LIVRTPILDVSCEISGPAAGEPVLLLHGWPDSAHAWDRVVPKLVERGCRTIVPSLRGFGETRFRDDATPRTAEPTALASDAIALLDALGIERAIVCGHDWGARIGYVLAALWPRRVTRLVACSVEYLTGITPGSRLNYEQQRAYWYQWFFASERGREALEDDRRGLCKALWKMWSPTWRFDDAQFEQAARAWDTPDWVEITLHSYRVRWGNAPVSPRYAQLETQWASHPRIGVPTVHLHGQAEGVALASALIDQSGSFSAGYRRELLPGIGHFVPREDPGAVLAAILEESGRA
jgi:pimeloyl-ACP methyl ester carboxylesterase